MSKDFIFFVEEIKDIVQNTDFENKGIIDNLCKRINSYFNVNNLLINKKGNILYHYEKENQKPIFATRDIKDGEYIDIQLNEQINGILKTKANIDLSQYYFNNVSSNTLADFKGAFFPLIIGGFRTGTFLVYDKELSLTDEEISALELCSVIFSIVIGYSQNEEMVKENRNLEHVKSAIGKLSFSELEAAIHIFDALEGTEGLLVASKIADKIGITRSVIVNALRKLESAEVIESRSLGMKGTYIKITNDYFMEEINSYRN